MSINSANAAPSAWSKWLGRSEERTDWLTATPLVGFLATLDRTGSEVLPGLALPPLAHWCYFLPSAPQHELGVDGHPQRGGFLPPVPLPRRMWAGGRLHFDRPLRIGEEVVRRSTVAKVDTKHGRSGELVFVTVRHEISNGSGVALREEHDLVYRGNPLPGVAAAVPVPAPTDEDFHRDIAIDTVMLFRYSALTFNGHRIHYDRSYATGVEHYPGLVVHGPLIATLLVDLLARELPATTIRAFSFQATKPLFDVHPFRVCGKRLSDGAISLWARDHQGALSMQARADLA